MLMPQPFSGRHDSFLLNYVTTGKAKILDSMREVLGQHKANFVFPIQVRGGNMLIQIDAIHQHPLIALPSDHSDQDVRIGRRQCFHGHPEGV